MGIRTEQIVLLDELLSIVYPLLHVVLAVQYGLLGVVKHIADAAQEDLLVVAAVAGQGGDERQRK